MKPTFAPIDIYFSTLDRASLIADLAALDIGLVAHLKQLSTVASKSPADESSPASEIPSPLQLVPSTIDATGNGHALDYIGRMVKTSATYDTTQTPPVQLTPAEYYPDDRANLRLFGPDAKLRADKITAAAFTHGTKLLPAPTSPKRRWA